MPIECSPWLDDHCTFAFSQRILLKSLDEKDEMGVRGGVCMSAVNAWICSYHKSKQSIEKPPEKRAKTAVDAVGYGFERVMLAQQKVQASVAEYTQRQQTWNNKINKKLDKATKVDEENRATQAWHDMRLAERDPIELRKIEKIKLEKQLDYNAARAEIMDLQRRAETLIALAEGDDGHNAVKKWGARHFGVNTSLVSQGADRFPGDVLSRLYVGSFFALSMYTASSGEPSHVIGGRIGSKNVKVFDPNLGLYVATWDDEVRLVNEIYDAYLDKARRKAWSRWVLNGVTLAG